MKSLIAILGLTLAGAANAGTAFFKYEVPSSGLIKQCVYDYLGNPYVINIQSYKICPITITV